MLSKEEQMEELRRQNVTLRRHGASAGARALEMTDAALIDHNSPMMALTASGIVCARSLVPGAALVI